jgi:hypothetical protein
MLGFSFGCGAWQKPPHTHTSTCCATLSPPRLHPVSSWLACVRACVVCGVHGFLPSAAHVGTHTRTRRRVGGRRRVAERKAWAAWSFAGGKKREVRVVAPGVEEAQDVKEECVEGKSALARTIKARARGRRGARCARVDGWSAAAQGCAAATHHACAARCAPPSPHAHTPCCATNDSSRVGAAARSSKPAAER